MGEREKEEGAGGWVEGNSVILDLFAKFSPSPYDRKKERKKMKV
jgi:hypothetical protein